MPIVWHHPHVARVVPSKVFEELQKNLNPWKKLETSCQAPQNLRSSFLGNSWGSTSSTCLRSHAQGRLLEPGAPLPPLLIYLTKLLSGTQPVPSLPMRLQLNSWPPPSTKLEDGQQIRLSTREALHLLRSLRRQAPDHHQGGH